MRKTEGNPVPVCSYADQVRPGPRFGIRSELMAAGARMPHRHDYFEILFFTSDASSQRIALRERSARRGSIFFIAPMTPHQARIDANASCFVIYFDLSYIRPDLCGPVSQIDVELLARARELSPFVYQPELDFVLAQKSLITIQHYCAQMLTESNVDRLCSTEVIRSYLILLLSEVTQNYEPQIRRLTTSSPPRGGAERHVRGVMHYISEGFQRRLTLADAARSVAVSPNYLANLLKRETGKSFVELLTERRIEQAGELLVFTNNRISRIAEATGFTDVDYFARRFKQVTGFTPSDFRRINSLDSDVHDARLPARM